MPVQFLKRHVVHRVRTAKKRHAITLAGIPIALFAIATVPETAPQIKSLNEPAMGVQGAPASLSLGPSQRGRAYHSPVFHADFEFNAVAPHWKEEAADEGSRRLWVRTSGDGRGWTDWMEVEVVGPLRDDDPRPDRIFAEVPVFSTGRFYQYRLELSRPTTATRSPRVFDLRFNYIDSRKTWLQKVSTAVRGYLGIAQAAEQGPSIVSRAGWGSPDPYGDSLKGQSNYWQPSYEPVKQVFLHHTVNSNSPSDPAAVVRAIWQYHAHTRGWGDIGYNYLVDHRGTVYEGRFGGDNVVAGHVFGFNRGSLGVALIGCFQSSSSTCNQLNGGNTTSPSSAMLGSLTTLLSWKTTNYEINPLATHTFCGNSCLSLRTIAGHRDAGSTSCPGDLAYNVLQTIRNQTDSKNKSNLWGYSAKQLSFQTADLANSDSASVTLQFKNTGTATWSNTPNRLLLKTANPSDRASPFQGTGWLDSTTLAVLNEPSVTPGGTGSFTFNLNRPSGALGLHLEEFRLVSEGNTELRGYFTLPVMTRHYAWSLESVSHSLGTALTGVGSTQTVTIRARNTGSTGWGQSDPYPVRLGIWWGSSGATRTSDWIADRRPATHQEATVAPGEVGTFSFTVTAPYAGEFLERVNLVAEGIIWFPDVGAWYYIRGINPYAWELEGVSHSKQTALTDLGESQTVTIKARNTGSVTWYKDGTHPVRLGVWGTAGSTRHSSWLAPNRLATFAEAEVAPGALATFSFAVQAPYPGEFLERINIVAENLTWSPYNGAWYYIRGINPYAWELASVSHSKQTALTNVGETQAVTIKAKNTGTATWSQTDPYPVRLAIWWGSSGATYTSSWIAERRPATFQEASVAPGGIATFSFPVTAPYIGEFLERVNLVAEGIAWFPDVGAWYYIRGQ